MDEVIYKAITLIENIDKIPKWVLIKTMQIS